MIDTHLTREATCDASDVLRSEAAVLIETAVACLLSLAVSA